VLATLDGPALNAVREAALCLKRGDVEAAGRLLDARS
jgi:hypothetical protein